MRPRGVQHDDAAFAASGLHLVVDHDPRGFGDIEALVLYERRDVVRGDGAKKYSPSPVPETAQLALSAKVPAPMTASRPRGPRACR